MAFEFDLYHAALAADDAFHAEVVRVFGNHRAGDMRYRPEAWDEGIRAAARAKHAADEAWLSYSRRMTA